MIIFRLAEMYRTNELSKASLFTPQILSMEHTSVILHYTVEVLIDLSRNTLAF